MHQSEKWRSFSRRFLEENPQCYVCGGKSTCTDHLEPSRGRIEVFERDGNFIPLCDSCHGQVTAKFDSKFVPGKSTSEPKIQWMNETRARNEIQQDRKFARPKYMAYSSK